jgi:hypothetical protein
MTGKPIAMQLEHNRGDPGCRRDAPVLPRRGDTLQLPFNDPNLDKEATTNGPEAQNESQDIRKER